MNCANFLIDFVIFLFIAPKKGMESVGRPSANP